MTRMSQTRFDQSRFLFFVEKGQHPQNFLSVLRSCGVGAVPVVDDLDQAIQSIISHPYDIIFITHYGQARESSLLLEELQGHDATAGLPVIAVGQDSQVKDILRIMAKGVSQVLIEPVSQREVENAIAKVLAQKDQREGEDQGLEAADKFAAKEEFSLAEPIYKALLDDPELGFQARLGLIGIAEAKEDWEQVEQGLKAALEMAQAEEDQVLKHRRLSQAFFRYGQYYEKRGAIKKALKSYRTAHNLNPFHLENMVCLLGLLQKEDGLDEILGLAQEAQDNFMPYSQPLSVLARSLADICAKFEELGMQEHAARLYQALVEIKHEDSKVHLETAGFFLKTGRDGLAVKDLLQACDRLREPELLCLLGTVLLGTAGGTEELKGPSGTSYSPAQAMDLAKQSFYQAMLLDSADPSPRLGLAACELKLGNSAAAGKVLERLKEGDSHTEEIYLQVIETLLQAKAYQMAGGWLKEAGSLFRASVPLVKLHARWHREQGQGFDAVHCLEKALTFAGDDLELLVDLAECYREAGQPSDAVFYYEKAIRLSPEDEKIKEGLRLAMLE